MLLTVSCEEGSTNPLLHIAAHDDAEPAYDLHEKFQAACDSLVSCIFMLVHDD